MKRPYKYRANLTSQLLLLFVFFLSPALALTPPRPIKNYPSISSGSFSQLSVGEFVFTITPPPHWGMGEISSSATSRSAFLTLFPESGSFGCLYEIQSFSKESDAQQELERLRATFSQTNSLQDGFEAPLARAWYACKINGTYLTQVWYSFTGKRSEKQRPLWDQLKNAVTITPPSPPPAQERPWAAAEFISPDFWLFNHPSNQLHVLLETGFLMRGQLKTDENCLYNLKITESPSKEGFFYLVWDQTNLKTINPYKNHLQAMFKDIKRMDNSQSSIGSPEYNLEDGYAIWNGHPYIFYTGSGDGFLFGFALKKNRFAPWKLESLIQQVKWWEDKQP